MQSRLKYGLVAAGGMSAWTLGEYLLGFHNTRLAAGQYSSWGPVVILVLALWRMLHDELYRPGRTWLPVGEGLLYGLLTGLVAAMGYFVFLFLYLNFINPDYADLRLEWQVARMRAAGQSEAAVRAMARGFRWGMGPVGLPATVFSLCLVAALIASPLLTLRLNWRRK
ncbi:MAG: DUF4199 family protein [Oleiharenicola lentus]